MDRPLERRELADTLLRDAINAAPDGIIIVDENGIIQFANPMVRDLFGYTTDELIGQSVDILVPDSVSEGHGARRTEYMQHPRTRAMGSGLDLHGRRQSGEEFPVEISLSPVNVGELTYVIAVVRDVTMRRETTEELTRAHEQLALLDDRERIARDLHDTVIQRLFAVGLSLQPLLGDVSEPRHAERVEMAIDEIDGTIRDIRTSIFSLHTRRMPSAGIRDAVLGTAREAARALGFEPRVAFEGPVDSAASDAITGELVPALREMLSNVVKHAAASKVAVTVVAAHGEIALIVADDGIGLTNTGGRAGHGLENMTARARALGGDCVFRAADGGGTIVEWRVPARRRA